MRAHSLFPSRLAKRIFFVLLFGFVVMQGAAIFIFTTYYNLSAARITTNEVAEEIIRSTHVAKTVEAVNLQAVLRAMNHHGVYIAVDSQPAADGQLLMVSDPDVIYSLVRAHPQHLVLSMPLGSGFWLNMVVHRQAHPWLLMGFVFSMSVVFFAIFFLCFGCVQRLALPVKSITAAAKRFGMDMNAPPMPVAGPPEVQELADTFNVMQNRIRRLINDRTQMLAAISHDLRTPITRLKLRAEYLEDKEQYKKAVADLDTMEYMINSILAFAREQEQDEAMERFDLVALIDTLLDDLTDIGYAVRWHDNKEITRLPFLGRLTGMRRALSNIIENAVKYGGEAEVQLQHVGGMVSIKVTDKGPGIPEAELEKVFAPFYRVDPARSPEKSGTGLGLAVARDIIRSHGGDIVLRNCKPVGLMAVVELPYGTDKEEI